MPGRRQRNKASTPLAAPLVRSTLRLIVRLSSSFRATVCGQSVDQLGLLFHLTPVWEVVKLEAVSSLVLGEVYSAASEVLRSTSALRPSSGKTSMPILVDTCSSCPSIRWEERMHRGPSAPHISPSPGCCCIADSTMTNSSPSQARHGIHFAHVVARNRAATALSNASPT